jgi:hypothetical protein
LLIRWANLLLRRTKQDVSPQYRGGIFADRRSSLAVEFAICGPVFFALLFVVFEVGYDQFLQEALDTALAVTARTIQTGNGQTYSSNGSAAPMDGGHVIKNLLYPASFGFLQAGSLFIRDEAISSTSCPDLYAATSGFLPVSGGVLNLGSYVDQNNSAGLNGTAPSTGCDITGSGTGYCNPAPRQPGLTSLVLISAIYVTPTFLGALLPGSQTYRYNGHIVRAILATDAFEPEYFNQNSLVISTC